MRDFVIIRRGSDWWFFVAEVNPDRSFSNTRDLDQARVWPDLDSAASALRNWVGTSVSFYLNLTASHASVHFLKGYRPIYEAVPLEQARVEEVMDR